MNVTVLSGDCRTALAAVADGTVDAVVCDPPYDLTSGSGGFMGASWDATGVAFDPATWREAARVLKPGGIVAAFGGTRTWHRLAVAIEATGLVVADQPAAWTFGSGFPKARRPLELDIIPAIEAELREQGVEGDIVWR